jgi:hypothetical protein
MKQSKMPADPNRRAKATVDIIDAILDGTPPAKDPERVKTGALGGRTRAANLSPEKRAEIARKAAAARWATKKAG